MLQAPLLVFFLAAFVVNTLKSNVVFRRADVRVLLDNDSLLKEGASQ